MGRICYYLNYLLILYFVNVIVFGLVAGDDPSKTQGDEGNVNCDYPDGSGEEDTEKYNASRGYPPIQINNYNENINKLGRKNPKGANKDGSGSDSPMNTGGSNSEMPDESNTKTSGKSKLKQASDTCNTKDKTLSELVYCIVKIVKDIL